MSAVCEAVALLGRRLAAAEAIGEALEAAAGDAPPAWVQVYREQLEGIRAASEDLEQALNACKGVDP